MSEKPPSKDEALEAMDFIVNVLKEHEKDLDRLVTELGTVADQLGESGEIDAKVKKIEDKITGLQADVATLVKSMQSASPTKTLPAEETAKQPKTAEPTSTVPSGAPLVLHCSQWEDFQNLAVGAQTLAFAVKEPEKILHITVLKGNQTISFAGEIPKLSLLLKVFLSKQTGVSEKQVLEGSIAHR
jgi:hypothetical protein